MEYYAVKRGYKCGLTTDKAEFEAQIDGYLNAEYEIFNSRQAAITYLRAKPAKKKFNDKYRGGYLSVIKAKKNF